jgi:hypothetical protein
LLLVGVGFAGFCEFGGGCGFLVGFADGFLLLAGFGLATAFFAGGFAGGGFEAGPAVLGGGGFLFGCFLGCGFLSGGHEDWDAGLGWVLVCGFDLV